MRPRLFPLRSLLSTYRKIRRLEPQQVQALASATQSIVISLAVIIGGAWTLYTFQAQLHVENAQAQLQKLKREIESEPRLEIDMTTQELDLPRSSERFILGTITVKNVGSANTVLILDEKPIRIYSVEVGSQREEWTEVSATPLKTGPKAHGWLVCHVGATTHAEFVARIDGPGLYVATFSATRSAAEATTVRSLEPQVNRRDTSIQWYAHHYFTVRQPSATNEPTHMRP